MPDASVTSWPTPGPDLEQAQAIASRLGLVAELARIHFLRGNLYFPSGNVEACSREHERALELSKRAGSVELEAMALGGLADVQFVSARMVSAYKLFDRCVRLAHEHGFFGLVAANRPMTATAQYYAGDTSAALDTALVAIDEAGKVGHKRGECIAHNAAVFCYRELQDYRKAFNLQSRRGGLELGEISRCKTVRSNRVTGARQSLATHQ